MRASARGVNLIARFEGCVLHAYKPVKAERYWTIGYGHYGPDVRAGQRITALRALQLLRLDLRNAEAAVTRLVKVGIGQERFDALVSFVFNVGAGNFASSTLLRKLNHGDYAGAGREFDRWTRGADGKSLPGLVARRNAEQALFNSPHRR
jgi:lysozyme